MRILVAGGSGFIGSNFIYYYLKRNPRAEIINIDKLTYAGNLDNLTPLFNKSHPYNKRHFFIKGDIATNKKVEEIFKTFKPDCVINFAAESHVDRSIQNSKLFIKTNIQGTQVLLDASRRNEISKFIQISTDEVYGTLGPKGKFRENHPLLPNSPYSASKAGADLLVRSYYETYKLPVIITRSSNNYGPYQFPEKLIPLFITNAVYDWPLPLYGDGMNVRDWLYVEDNCEAISLILEKGKEGEIYNIGGKCEKTNLEITITILKHLKKPETLIKFVKDRPGHDRRYALDINKIGNELGWQPKFSFETGIKKTLEWYLKNRSWWEKIKSGKYLTYYKKFYKEVHNFV
ncbi:MAG: dTDP-glucose 4,6-dehydratase [Thermodesulfobacteriota bacterium]|nr:dTDP-glucose 4,6-dehydratase [Thermodesulfobacteriota bacterium]